jgi:hypothetical protein
MFTSRWRLLAVMVAAWALSPSCSPTRGASAQQKQASFAPMAGLMIGQEGVEEFARRRSVLLVAGGEISGVSLAEDGPRLAVPPGPGPEMELAQAFAVAVSGDGYFLACAHSLEKRPVYLCAIDGEIPRIAQARVVWSGDPAAAASDLAVIHADFGSRPCFTWASPGEIDAGTDIVGWGMGPGAGRMTSAFSARHALGIDASVAFHQMPICVGDSGGPVMTVSGQLVGINSRIKGSWNPHAGQTEIVRPDLDWLDITIARDRAARFQGAKRSAGGLIEVP